MANGLLPADLLARVAAGDQLTRLREDLEDSLKEYRQFDLLVELLQNALDAIEERRYRELCATARLNPASPDVIDVWNEAVLKRMKDDFDRYDACADYAAIALFYGSCEDDGARRAAWWNALASGLHDAGLSTVSADELAATANSFRGSLRIRVETGNASWLTVEDDGIGISDVPAVFIHKASAKRAGAQRIRRLGVRGSHGWGLTAVLALSERVEVVSRVADAIADGYSFSDYASFTRGAVPEPRNEVLDPSATPASRELLDGRRTGTFVRVQVSNPDPTDLFGNTLMEFSHAKLETLLRLYTPVGQANDYVFHPAYHTARRGEIVVSVESLNDGAPVGPTTLAYDYFRMSGHNRVVHQSFREAVNQPERERSVHVIHRSLHGNAVLLGGGDVQWSKVVHNLETEFEAANALPGFEADGEMTAQIPRGFGVALSGGMRSELIARPPKGNTGNYRGLILSETAAPTLGRKYVMDQRAAIPRSARGFEAKYNELRKRLLPAGEPLPQTPAAFQWLRHYVQTAIDSASLEPPSAAEIGTWAGASSLEARVMLLFADLVARGFFGNLHIMRAHLSAPYDFVFLYMEQVQVGSTPAQPLAHSLAQNGYARYDAQSGSFYRYAVGEFKAVGETVLDDFADQPPIKRPDTIDLLVCWSFDEDVVDGEGWSVEDPPGGFEFRGQTHSWLCQSPGRTRPLAVSALETLITRLVDAGELTVPAWPGLYPPSQLE